MGESTVRIDYVSPLPPVRSGIADYSADLLPSLAAQTDLRLIQLTGQPVDPAIAARWPMAPVEEMGADGRLPLYQMGNNRWHQEVLELALTQPGVLTLHDIVLHHLLLNVTMGRETVEGYEDYKARLALDHGWIGTAAALAKRWGAWGDAPVFSLPAHRTLLRRQRGVLVHSRWGAELLLEEDPDLRVRAIPMGVPLPPAAGPEAGLQLRRRLGLPEQEPILGSFGFQTPIKRTNAVIKALAAPGLERVHLLVVGESSPSLDLADEARRAGVAERVHVLGFLPYEDFEAAIAAVDLCLNLRYPTAGETSASLLRVLALGCPAVVSDYAQFADLPHEVALRVPLGDEEAAALPALLRSLLADPARLKAMGTAAREHVRLRHDPAAAAEAVAAACRDWAELPPPGDTPCAAPSPSSLAWGRLPGEMEVQGVDLPWPAGERRRLRIGLRNTGFARWLAGERGPGGVALVVKLFVDDDLTADLHAGRPWLPLARDLDPGEEAWFEVDVRRPPGTAHLWIEPHLFGGLGLSKYGGPLWEGRI